MSDINGWSSTASGSPAITYTVTYSQTGRSGSSASYHFNFAVHLGSSGSTFGYTIGYHLTINGQTFSGLIKDNTSWSGTTVHNIGVDVTPSCGAGGGTLSCSFYTDRPNNDGTAGQVNTGGGYTVSVSAWNTAPYWNSGACSVSPSGTIPENTTSLTISWSGASDTEGGTLTYYLTRYYDSGDGNGWISQGVVATTTSTSYTDTIPSGNQGSKYYYTVYIKDNGGLTSNTISSNTVTKNVFTPSNISTSSSIGFSSTSIAFTLSGIGNTNGDTTFYYSLSCSQVTVYNPTSSPSSVTIWNGSGSAPTGSYIKFADIKTATQSKNYTDTFTFTLTSSNIYGSSSSKNCTINVDIRIAPIAPTLGSVGGYCTINSTNYFITNKQKPTLSWSGASDKLGGSLTYDIQVKIGTGDFITVLSNQTNTSAVIPIDFYMGRPVCVIRVIAKTTFGYTSYTDSSGFVIDYYNSLTITFNDVIRNLNDTTVSGNIILNTSIPNITVSTLTYSGKTSGSLTLATTFSKQETGLLDSDTYAFSITAQDQAGAVLGLANVTSSISIPKYTPMFSVREKGVGINTYADTNNKFKVVGNSKLNGTISADFSGITKYENVASYNYGNNITGTIKITLPTGYTSTMISIEVDGYSYNGIGGWKMILGGYYYVSSPNGWANTSVKAIGSIPTGLVRFGYDGSKCCILLGSTSTTWSYPKIIVSSVIAGHTNFTGLEGGWSISLITSETGITIQSTPTINSGFNVDSVDGYHVGNASGYIPLNNGTLNPNLNAQMINGYTSSQLYNTDNCVYGSNSYGYWIQYPSGIMEIWQAVPIGSYTIGYAWGNLYSNGTARLLPNFPVSFVDVPVVTMSFGNDSAWSAWMVNQSSPTTTTPPSYELCRPSSVTMSGLTIYYHATGRWK